MPEFRESKSEDDGQKRSSGISRAIGATSEEEKYVLGKFKDKFDNPGVSPDSEIGKYERAKTPEEIKIIEAILSELPKFLERYGVCALPITLNHIHIIDSANIEELKKKMDSVDTGAIYTPFDQLVAVFDSGNNLRNAQRIIHELIHFNSFQSIELDQVGIKSYRRVGFEVQVRKSQKNIYFNKLNEAITTELSKKFDYEYFGDIPELGEDFLERKSLVDSYKKNYPDKADRVDDIAVIETAQEKEGEHKDKWKTTIESYTYYRERVALNKMIGEIYNKKKDEFESEEEVFNVFAKAAMTGNLMPATRLVEKVFGKGSFRKLGEDTKGSRDKKAKKE